MLNSEFTFFKSYCKGVQKPKHILAEALEKVKTASLYASLVGQPSAVEVSLEESSVEDPIYQTTASTETNHTEEISPSRKKPCRKSHNEEWTSFQKSKQDTNEIFGSLKEKSRKSKKYKLRVKNYPVPESTPIESAPERMMNDPFSRSADNVSAETRGDPEVELDDGEEVGEEERLTMEAAADAKNKSQVFFYKKRSIGAISRRPYGVNSTEPEFQRCESAPFSMRNN